MSAPVVAADGLFLRACAREPVPRPPVWIMRQAGRYLPEYRALRERHGFLEVCRTPELAAEVSAMPVERFPLDAAIVMSDILIPAAAMGVEVDFRPGPVIARPIASASDVAALRAVDAETDLAFVPETIRILIERLRGRVPVIGFAGAPFTVAAYLVEGEGSRGFERVKAFLFREPALARALIDKIASVTISHLAAQRRAGASALMLFDTHASILSPEDFESFAAEPARRVLAALGGSVPRIYFAPGAPHFLGRIARLGAEVVGADFRIGLDEARRVLGDGVAVQGNLDPAVLLAPRETVAARTIALLRANGGRPGHIVNLGHGILPGTPLESVEAFLATVHGWSPAHAESP
jgi:uroporphyrinogen decarboxylase